MIHFLETVQLKILISFFLFHDRRSIFVDSEFLSTSNTCMQGHADTRWHTQNTLRNIAKHTLNDSAVQRDTCSHTKPVLPACERIANNQGYSISPVAKRPKLITGLTLSAYEGLCTIMCLRFYCMCWHQGLFFVFFFKWEQLLLSEPLPLTCHRRPSFTALLTFCRSTQSEEKRKKFCVIKKLTRWMVYNKEKSKHNTNLLFGTLWTVQLLLDLCDSA